MTTGSKIQPAPMGMAPVLRRGAILAGLMASAAATPALAQTVVNPGFESGDFTGWTTEQGTVGSTSFPIDESWFTSSPASRATIRNAGEIDSITGIPSVFAGQHSARINDSVNDYSAVALRQTVTGYNSNKLYYAWNAVLEPSHGENDSPAFLIKVTDKTSNTIITNISYSAYTAQNASSFFRDTGNGYVTSDWKVEDIDTVAGHDYEMLFIGVDCPYGGHAGYVYVDAFGNAVPTPNAGIDFDPNTDVVKGASFLIGGNSNIDDAINDTLSGLIAGTLNPVFDGGTLHINQVPGGPLTVAFTVSDLGGVVDTNGNDVEFAGGVTGTGILTKIGDGTWMLSGINLINGGVVVNQGGLNVAGTLSTLVLNVNAGGRLGGRGSIVAAVNINSGGILAPGNSPGTLTIIGSPLVMNSGSTYQAEIDGRTYSSAGGAGSYDRIVLTTGATFTAGGTLAPILRGISAPANNTFTPVLGDRFKIVDGGTVTGAFATVTQPTSGLSANTRFDVLYNPTSIELVTTPGSLATLGTTSGWKTNAIAAGAGLDAVRPAAGTRNGTLQTLFNGLYGYDATGYRDALQQLSGEIYTHGMAVAGKSSQATVGMALDEASSAIAVNCDENRDGKDEARCTEDRNRPAIWTRLFYEKGNLDADAISAGFESEEYGFAAGVHVINRANTRIGLGGRYSETDIKSTIGSTAKLRGHTLFLYASHDFGPVTLNGLAGYGTTDADNKRTQTLITGSSVSTSSSKMETLNLALEAKGRFSLGNRITLRPVLGITHQSMTGKAVVELNSNPQLALLLPETKWDVTRSKAGATIDFALGNSFTLSAGGTWSHALDGSNTAVRRVTLGTAAWNVSSVGIKDDTYEFGAGIAGMIGANTKVRLDYTGFRDGGSYSADRVMLGVSHAF